MSLAGFWSVWFGLLPVQHRSRLAGVEKFARLFHTSPGGKKKLLPVPSEHAGFPVTAAAWFCGTYMTFCVMFHWLLEELDSFSVHHFDRRIETSGNVFLVSKRES